MTTKQLIDLPIGPGVYTEQTERGAVGQWKAADKVRFRKGLAEKIGGWVRLQPQFFGIARRLKDWTSLDARTWTAIGTDKKLYLWQDETLYDITPLRDSGVLTAPFDTTLGSSIVNVNHINHGVQVGDFVRFSGAIAGGGITVDGEYTVASVVDQDNYTIVDDETATSTANNTGGTPSYEYDISTGTESVISATGWNAGGYGTDRSGYNTPLVSGFNALLVPIRTWTLDNWGEDLLACPRGGKIYWWDRTEGATSRAVALGGDAPQTNEGVIISQRDRHVIALGAYDFFNDRTDPLLIRWSSTEDLNDWIPTSTNTAGDLRLYSGSKIVAGVRSRLELVIFTDVSVHTLPFVGGFDVFGLNIVGENVSILGPNCAVSVDSRVFFMAEADFYMYDGIVRVLPCDVRNFVYQNLNVQQKDKIYGGLNREFNEVWWFYPSYDPNTWVQDTFELGLPPGYSLANASAQVGDPDFANVILLAKFDGSDAATAYTELARSEPGTFEGNAQLDTATQAAGSASLLLDGAGDAVVFGDNAPSHAVYNLGASEDATVDAFIRFATLPTVGEEWQIVNIANQDFVNVEFQVRNNGGTYELRGRFGFGNFPAVAISPSTGVWYHVAVQRRATANFVDLLFNGAMTTVASSNTPSAGALDPVLIGAWDNASNQIYTEFFDGHIDSVRITYGTARYAVDTTYTIPDADFPEAAGGGGPADIGYVYNFNSGGYTERVPTADNSYEHDYFLTNADPILTPLESEYAVEMDVNPDIGAGTGSAGLLFLRTDATGTPLTDADDCYEWMVELDYNAQLVRVLKKEAAAPTNPDNLVSNTIDFTTLTGSAMVTDQKYIISVQFDTPQITVWVDGFQAFQFDMSAAELAQFTSGTAGLHAAPDTAGDQYRFYNFASGPLGTITAADFDISPIEVNRYVAFNYEEGTWTIGKLARSAWADRSPQLEKAYAAGLDGYLYQHETGTDDNGAAMTAYIESFDFEIPQAGENLMHVDQLVPDFLELEGTVNLYLSGRKYPQDLNRITKGPYPVQAGVRKLSTRIRARQVALRVESTTTGDKWRLGTIRGRAGAHGKRG
jgi:hypothetical protein